MLDALQKRAHILLQPAQFGDVKSRSVDNALHLLVFLNLIAVTLVEIIWKIERLRKKFESDPYSLSFEEMQLLLEQEGFFEDLLK